MIFDFSKPTNFHIGAQAPKMAVKPVHKIIGPYLVAYPIASSVSKPGAEISTPLTGPPATNPIPRPPSSNPKTSDVSAATSSIWISRIILVHVELKPPAKKPYRSEKIMTFARWRSSPQRRNMGKALPNDDSMITFVAETLSLRMP